MPPGKWDVSTIQQVAEFFGRGPDAVAKWVAEGMPRGRAGGTDAKPIYAYPLDRIAQWRLARVPRGKPIDDDPDLFADVDSPGLERYRLAKAALTEMDLAERQGKSMPLGEFWDWWEAKVASKIRRGVERLSRRFGHEAVAIMTEELNAASVEVNSRCGNGCRVDSES